MGKVFKNDNRPRREPCEEKEDLKRDVERTQKELNTLLKVYKIARDYQEENTGMRKEVTCPICLESRADYALGCGHTLCGDCGPRFSRCPKCRANKHYVIQLYPN